MGADPGSNKYRKAELDKNKEIHCGRCPYHRGENRGSRVPKDRSKPKHLRRRKRGGVREFQDA